MRFVVGETRAVRSPGWAASPVASPTAGQSGLTKLTVVAGEQRIDLVTASLGRPHPSNGYGECLLFEVGRTSGIYAVSLFRPGWDATAAWKLIPTDSSEWTTDDVVGVLVARKVNEVAATEAVVNTQISAERASD